MLLLIVVFVKQLLVYVYLINKHMHFIIMLHIVIFVARFSVIIITVIASSDV